jgi:TonB family protein
MQTILQLTGGTMLRKMALLSVLALAGSAGGHAAAQGLGGPDRSQTLDQILANCDRSTGLPPGIKPHTVDGPRRKVIINPDWLKRPDAKRTAAAYPAAARAAHVGGKAVVECLVGADGHPHDCRVKEETPPGMGFGDAAVQLSQETLFIPKRIDCEPVDGGLVSIPMTFPPV